MTHACPHAQRRARAALIPCAVALTIACVLFVGPPAVALGRGTARASHRHASVCTIKRGKRHVAARRAGRTCKPVNRGIRNRRRHPGGPLEAVPIQLPGSGPAGQAAPGEGSPPVGESQQGGAEQGFSGGVVTDPIDPKYLTELPFGSSSFWIQPWRAYLDTWPASRLLESVGINFNVSSKMSEDTAQLLEDSGFKYARIGINWHSLSYTDPTVFWNEADKRARLTALQRHGLRPLIILDANSLAPAPSKRLTLTTLGPAPAGSTTVALTPESAAAVVPGKTGFNELAFNGSPDLLIKSVSAGGLATLSKPLPAQLEAGAHPGTTLLYAPFTKPTLANGSPNPLFQESLDGWLHYVSAVTKFASSVVGPGGYDIEVWNELAFGSQFLNAEHYYTVGSASEEECPETGITEEGGPEECSAEIASKETVNKEIRKAILDATVALLRDPASGVSPAVGITNGFASQTPFPSGAKAPLGLTALSKHPYATLKEFPSAYTVNRIRPINALGQGDRISRENPAPQFIPTFDSLFPEYRIAGIKTETMIRDLAPFTTEVYGFPHGREVGPPGGVPVQKWVTEYNLAFKKTTVPVGPDGVTPQTSATVTAADKAHFQAKALLRSLVSMVNKGVTREYFYAAANAGNLSMISERFTSAVEADPSAYPGDELGGETMSAFHSLLSQFNGPGPGPDGARQLKLTSIAQDGNHAQFKGDGTAAHPDLYDREVLAVLPFQSSPTHFTIPVYVMTRDLLTLYDPNAPTSDIHRFDLPEEKFRITLANLPASTTAPTISSYDPLRHENTTATLLSRERDTATIELTATDYPRILNVQYSGG